MRLPMRWSLGRWVTSGRNQPAIGLIPSCWLIEKTFYDGLSLKYFPLYIKMPYNAFILMSYCFKIIFSKQTFKIIPFVFPVESNKLHLVS